MLYLLSGAPAARSQAPVQPGARRIAREPAHPGGRLRNSAYAPGTAGGCRRVRYEPVHQTQRKVFGRAWGFGPGTPLAVGSHRS